MLLCTSPVDAYDLARAQPLPDIITAAAPSEPPAAEAPMPDPMAPGMSPCSIKVIGVGGGGGNTLNRMVSAAGGR